MEKKTLGTFLAALRRSSGMTQKQLAEKLNVSDKAVSRWERDECAPDLSLIPVIAEIFGITSDELLRGQRKSPGEAPLPQEEKKTEKQIRHLLNSAHSRFSINSLIAGTIGAVGFIVAMICNLGFLRAYLGFFVSLVFYIGAACCETVFLIQSRSSVRDAELPQEMLADYNRAVLRTVRFIYGMIAFLFAVTLPLILYPWDPYQGLSGGQWLLTGAIFGGFSIAASIVTSWISQSRQAKSGKISLTDADVARVRLREKLLRIAAIVLCVTLVLHWGFNIFAASNAFIPGTTFHNWEDFKAFMETPTDYDGFSMQAVEGGVSDMVYVTEEGNFIYPEEVLQETVRNQHGDILCSYQNLNLNAVEIRYGTEEDGLLPVTVYTNSQHIQAANIRDNINSAFILLYFIECIGLVVYYLRKSKQIR